MFTPVGSGAAPQESWFGGIPHHQRRHLGDARPSLSQHWKHFRAFKMTPFPVPRLFKEVSVRSLKPFAELLVQDLHCSCVRT